MKLWEFLYALKHSAPEIGKWQKNVPEARHMANWPLGKWYQCLLSHKFWEVVLFEILRFKSTIFDHGKIFLERCRIKFWTTFVLFTKFIFPLLLELESFKDFQKYCQAPGPGLDQWSLTWPTWSLTWPNLA